MAKFINKKERVFDIKLTNYGKHLMSTGKFEPVYYSFMDDNIIYDGEYAGITEKQNEVVERIKDDSQYIESLVGFEDAENQLSTFISTEIDPNNPGRELGYFEADVNNMTIKPRADSYVLTSVIGDAFLDGDTQVSPAWKLVALQGKMTSSTPKDEKNNINIPQVNIEVIYSKDIQEFDQQESDTNQDFRESMTTTEPFVDNKVIKLIREDLILYGEEVNTNILTENFDIEVFEIFEDQYPKTCVDCNDRDVFKRKYFSNDKRGIKGGKMDIQPDLLGAGFTAVQSAKESQLLSRSEDEELTTDAISYYFDILVDNQVDKKTACKLSKEFNKQSYYVDIDFDCEQIDDSDPIEVDIYGKVTEPEICL